MKMSKITLIVILLTTLAGTLYGCVHKNQPKFATHPTFESASGAFDPSKPGAIVRLHNDKNQFFCSGTVIGKNYVLTAAHCLVGKKNIWVVTADQTKRVKAKVESYEERSDQGLVSGNFEDFNFGVLASDGREVMEIIFNPESRLMACGYPYGGKLLCIPVRVHGPYDFDVDVVGALYPGMSGGPVVDINTGKIVATNYAMYGSICLVAPTVEIFANLNIPQ